MIAARKAGTVRIIARAGAASGSATLNITHFNAGDYRRRRCVIQRQRLQRSDIQLGLQGLQMADKNIACRGCAGDGAQFLAVKYTPLPNRQLFG